MKKIFGLVFAGMLLSLSAQSLAWAKSGIEIDASVDAALERFAEEVDSAEELIKQAKGVLILPKVVKAGIGLGGEYGEGALRVKGETVAYYNTVGGSFGFQLGAQVKDIYLLFMEQTALESFRGSEGWKVGVDGSVALVTLGANGQIDSTQLNQPVIGFVLGQKGLMYNLTLEGSKFNKLDKS